MVDSLPLDGSLPFDGLGQQGYRMKKFFIKNKNLFALSQGTSHNKAIKGAGQNLP